MLSHKRGRKFSTHCKTQTYDTKQTLKTQQKRHHSRMIIADIVEHLMSQRSSHRTCSSFYIHLNHARKDVPPHRLSSYSSHHSHFFPNQLQRWTPSFLVPFFFGPFYSWFVQKTLERPKSTAHCLHYLCIALVLLISLDASLLGPFI